MKTPIRTTLVAVAAAAAGLVAVPAFSQSASGGTPPATQATPQPGAGMHGGHGLIGTKRDTNRGISGHFRISGIVSVKGLDGDLAGKIIL